MAQLFNVVYQGELRPAADEGRFVEQFSQRFGVSAVQAKKLVRAGKKVTIKKSLPEEQAEKLRTELESLGMRIELQPVAGGAGGAVGVQAATANPGETCPKCGSHRIADDSCLDCGIIVSKYKQIQAEKAQDPYAAPEAELVDDAEPGEMQGPIGLPAGQGWSWISGGFGLFKASWGAWIGLTLVLGILAVVVALVPLIGGLALQIFMPVIVGGIMLGAAELDEGGDLRIGHLFAGFSANWGQLALVGLLFLVGSILIGVVMFMLLGGAFFGMMGAGMAGPEMSPDQAEAMMMGMWPTFAIAILLALGLSVPLYMAFWFAPALVALDDMPAVSAMKLSFVACWRNILPFLIYGVILSVLGLLVTFLTLGIGYLVLAPVVWGSMYVAYRQIFFAAED